MDQTKLFQLRTALLWESAYGCMTTRRLIIQWSQKILIIDIIISWKLLWDQRPQTIRILHEWNTETPHFQSKWVLVPELRTCSREDRLPHRLIQIQWNLYNETGEVLLKKHKFHHLPGMVFTKSCLFSLSWKTTCLERPQNLVVAFYRFHCNTNRSNLTYLNTI